MRTNTQRQKKKNWREFEKLVARIEKILAPQGAIIKSPDRLTDKVTGQSREVDASIRYRVGSVEILITVECRDRKNVPDDTWIEQLITKRQKIGASHTIAVSNSGFTKTALESARLYGIETRMIKNITDEEILFWLSGIKIENQIGKVSLKGMRVKVFDNQADLPLAPSTLQALENKKLQAKIFYSQGDSRSVSLADVLESFVRIYNPQKERTTKSGRLEKQVLTPGNSLFVEMNPQMMTLFNDVPINANGLALIKTFTFHLDEGGLQVETINGPKYVKTLEIDLALAKDVVEVPIARKVSYTSDDKSIANIAEADIELFHFDRKENLTLSLKLPTEINGPMEINVTNDKSMNPPADPKQS